MFYSFSAWEVAAGFWQLKFPIYVNSDGMHPAYTMQYAADISQDCLLITPERRQCPSTICRADAV